MSNTEQFKRRANRVALQLPVRVEVQLDQNDLWSEITYLKKVSALGAGFLLKQPVREGRLLLLTMPLPRPLRCYDHCEHQYCVWSIVRHCAPLSVKDQTVYDLGVAFVGKNPPLSYKENPLTIYRIFGAKGGGLWEIGEDKGASLDPQAPSPNLPQPRYAIPLNVYIAISDSEGKIIAHERTVTENISLGGASVFSNLPVKIGDSVKVICAQYRISLVAEVRHLRRGGDGLPRMHLRFLNQEFPLSGIEQV
jgi:hypothetical protein